MKRLLLFIVIFSSLSVGAQTKKVTHSEFKTWSREVYYVLKSDKNVREGEYQKYSSAGSHSELLVDGYYRNNLKDSVWKYYSDSKLVGKGNYKNGEKVGEWIGYTRGFESFKYNFSKNEMVAFINNPGDSTQTSSIITDSNAGVVFDRQPIYVSGITSLFRNISNSVKYPAEAREARKQGEVIIGFTVDEKGTTGNYIAKTNLGYGLETTALNAVKNVLGEWVPAVVNGKPAAVQCELSLLFAIYTGENVLPKTNQIVIMAAGVPIIRSF
ncbi:TonB family protein [Mucilaginibacter sp. UYNi724]